MKNFVVVFLLICGHILGQSNQLTHQELGSSFAVYFDYKSYTLDAKGKAKLDTLLHMLNQKAFKLQRIELTGYCDSIASNAYNDALSLKRADAVGNYFKEHGIADTLIKTIVGYGKRRPINSNSDSIERRANRRVEIVFMVAIPDTKNNVAAPQPGLAAQPITDSSKPILNIADAKVNDIIELKDINFYPNRHVLLKGAKKNLQILISTMQAYKTLKIEIRGHVCCLPPEAGDSEDEDSGLQDLSLERAKAVYSYLVENGIEPNRMTYIGLGASMPKVEEFTDEDKAKNRRVEIKITGK